jgi:hypothetical protein
LTSNEISDIFGKSDCAGIDIRAEIYYLENVLKEIECDIAYLEDVPDELLIPFDGKFDVICERLRTLDEYLHNVKNVAKI